MSVSAKNVGSLSHKEFWEEYEKVKRAWTKVEFPAKHYEIFGKPVSSHNFTKTFDNKKSKQVVIKLISNMGVDRLRNSINYAIKNSENDFAINERGEKVSMEEIMKEWSENFSTRANSKEAWHLVFSVDENNLSSRALKALQSSVKETMDLNFFGHKYAMILHTHQAKPHIHLILNKYNFLEGKRIHFKNRSDIKNLFNNLRESFACSLRVRGFREYENRNTLEKDLEKTYNKFKRAEEHLKIDSNTQIHWDYAELNENFERKIRNKKQRIVSLKNDYDELKIESNRLQELLDEYIKTDNKKKWGVFREYKEQGRLFGLKNRELLREIKELNNLSYKLDLSKEKQREHFKTQTQEIIKKRNFIRVYERLFPKHKGATKKEMQIYHRVKEDLSKTEKEAEKSAKFFSENFYKDVFYENTNLFKLAKQHKELNLSIQTIELSKDYFLQEKAKPFVDKLEDNRKFIEKIAHERFLEIERILLENKKNKSKFLLKEYEKGCEFLKKENKLQKSAFETKKTSSSYQKIQEKYRPNEKTNEKNFNM